MLELTHSPFLQALGFTIINSLWQFALLWLVYVSLSTLFKLSSRHNYSIGLFLQFSGFIWFTITFAFYFSEFSQQTIISDSIHLYYFSAVTPGNTSTIGENVLSLIARTEKLLPYLSISYLALLVFTCCRWIRACNYTKSIGTIGLEKIEVTWRIFVERLSIQLGIKREVRIFLLEIVTTPLTIGFFKPLILLPLASINHLSTEQMEAVIMHELAHIKRFDYLFNLFLAFVEITLFFNPFMRLISKHIKRERENCCDDWVLQYEYSATSYANALLQIATGRSSSPVLAMKAAEDKYVLLSRIKRIIEKKEKTFFNYRYQLVAFFVMLTVLSSLALLSSSHNANNAIVSSSDGREVGEQMTASVNNSLLDPVFFPPSRLGNTVWNNEPGSEKSQQRIIEYTNKLVVKTEPKNTNCGIARPNSNAKRTFPAPPPPPLANNPLLPDNYPSFPEDLEKDQEISNVNLDEVEFPVDALKEREVALAEEKLKDLAIHVFDNKKAAVLDQKKIIREMKAAFEKIKAVKIQLELAKRRVNDRNERRVNINENLLRTVPQLAPCNVDRLQQLARDMQEQLEQEKKQLAIELAQGSAHDQNNLNIPSIIYHLPWQEKPHSFSFEISTEQQVKFVNPKSFYKPKKEKKINKISVEEGGNKEWKSNDISPYTLNNFFEKPATGDKNVFVIKI